MGDARDDVATFAEKVMRRPLWPHQLKAARAERFVTSVAAARRTGKTTLVETLAAWTCFRERGVRAVVLSANQESSRRVIEELSGDLAASRLTRDAVADDLATRLRFANGSEVVSLPASQKAVRGLGRGVKLLVVDEAGFVDDELWRAARYVALDERERGGRILLTGTPWGVGFFRAEHRAGEQGDAEHASFHWSYEASPLLDHAYLERQRDLVPSHEYASEVEGRWVESGDAYFDSELLLAATADYEPPDLAALHRPRVAAGIDWGIRRDASAMTVVAAAPVLVGEECDRARYLVAGIVHQQAGATARYGTFLDRVTAAGRRLDPIWVASETNGVGAAATEELRRRVGGVVTEVFSTQPVKAEAYGRLRTLMETGRFVLPRQPALLRELGALRGEVSAAGGLTISADARAHDDLADSLALSLGPRVADGRASCRIAAYDHHAPPVVEPNDESEVARTGSGIGVPRRAVLVDLDGGQIHFPHAPPESLREPIDWPPDPGGIVNIDPYDF